MGNNKLEFSNILFEKNGADKIIVKKIIPPRINLSFRK
jgi:hypothetical protein